MLDPRNYAVQETLRDGTVVVVRAARPGDGGKIRRAFRNLDAETIHSRFFGYKSDVTDAELDRITHLDFVRDVALLVTTGEGAAEIVIGGASYFAMDPESPGGGAEVAFTVEEDYQRLGIAGSLIRHLIRLARPAGFTRLEADVLSHNLPMLAVFKRSGLPITVRNEGAVVHVMLSLSPSPE